MEKNDGDTPASMRRFVSEKDLEEARQRRQEEWEKARQSRPDLPAPDSAETTSSGKTLYEQLHLQKQKKEEDLAESRKFKNMIRGLDDDESEYLNTVSKRQMEADRLRLKEQEELINELRKQATSGAASSTPETSVPEKEPAPVKPAAQPAPNSMSSLLRQAVKRKTEPSNASNPTKGAESGPAEKQPSVVKNGNGTTEPPCNHHPIVRQIGVLPSIVSAYADVDSDDDGCCDSSDSSEGSSSDCSVSCDGKSHDHNGDDVASFRPSIAPALMRRIRRELQGGDE